MAAARHQLDQHGLPKRQAPSQVFSPTTIFASQVSGAPLATDILTAPGTPSPVAPTITTATNPETTTASRATTSSLTTTSAAASENASKTTNILIPAVVAPVGAILIIAFVLFWWVMRRRAQRDNSKEPEFVMEKRRPVRKHSRDDSTHSSSSTRKLVSKPSLGNSMNKEPVASINELPKTSLDLFHNGRSAVNGYAIGVANSPEHTPSHSRQNSAEDQNPSGPPVKAPVTVRNFSRGPSRPSTATQERDQGPMQYQRDRSMSSPGSRPPLPQGRADSRDPVYLQGQTSMMNRPDPRRPPPSMRGPDPMAQPRGPPRGQPHGNPMTSANPSRPNNVPPAIQTRATELAQKSSALSPPTPTGAYNGASPISQYSPIIKGTSKLGTSPPNLSLDAVPPGPSEDSPSTPQMTSFSEENMRIARLADSSRLGFYKDNGSSAKNAPSTIATSVVEESAMEPPNPSPRLPPPATRELPPLNFPPPPPPPADSPAMLSSNSRRADSFMNDRRSMRSMVSRLSDGEYVDMEVDAKSDVSSLDERERWEMEQENGNLAAGRAVNGSQYSLGRY